MTASTKQPLRRHALPMEVQPRLTSEMLLVESRQIARTASSQSGKEEKRNDDEEGDNDKKSVDVHIGILRLGPFEDIGRSVAVVVHVFGQPAGVTSRQSSSSGWVSPSVSI